VNNRETIEGVEGEWRTVTKASEVKVGQRVRCKGATYDAGYYFPKIILEIKGCHAFPCNEGNKEVRDLDLFAGIWQQVQAFFPIEKPIAKPVKQHKPVKPHKRPPNHERLLKALLRTCQVNKVGCLVTNDIGGFFGGLTRQEERELIAIKERMEKKGAK